MENADDSKMHHFLRTLALFLSKQSSIKNGIFYWAVEQT
jgi:hypothetical protein